MNSAPRKNSPPRKKQEVPPPLETPEIERMIEGILSDIPSEISGPWNKRYESLPDKELPAFAEELRDFAGKRQAALIRRAPEAFEQSHHLVTDEDKIGRTLGLLAEIEGRADQFIDGGKTAHVYGDPNDPAICYKFVKDFTEYSAWNSVAKEGEFLEMLEDLEVNGVRTPRLTGVIDHPDIKVIAMERLNAVSLERVLKGLHTLSENFDINKFFSQLDAYMQEMHKRCIYHRDLHEGNILVDLETNQPYIIDFGRSSFSPNVDWAYEAYDSSGQIKVNLTTDEEYVARVRTALRAHMAKLKRQSV